MFTTVSPRGDPVRRRSFVGILAGISAGAAGCLDRRDGDRVPDGMTVETRHWVADILAEGLWYQRTEQNETINRFHRLIRDETMADLHVDGDDDDVAAFVEATDFDRSDLLVVQNMMQSARWLELAGIQRTDSGLSVVVATKSPDGPYGDDAAVHSLAIRLTGGKTISPEEFTVSVDGNPTGT